MIKQLTKKKLNNKKGFTLAELLVVIAILAILIAIAIPVFSGMVADANLRVNQANVRSVRSAGVAHILTRLDAKDDTDGGDIYLNAGLAENQGWIAVANVNNNGDVTDLKVFVCNPASHKNGIAPKDIAVTTNAGIDGADSFAEMKDEAKTTDSFATLRPTTSDSTVYTVQAVIKDLDPED